MRHRPRPDAATEILRRPGQQAPGLHTVYADDGYTLAVVAVEAKLGEPWEVLLPAVLAPLIPASQSATIGFGGSTGLGSAASWSHGNGAADG
ncbi:MAG: hypothetical protein JKY37_26025 [Nannocystaceae bacterium]|nr:hypothetical protein [Nannocystaceae bacterium]